MSAEPCPDPEVGFLLHIEVKFWLSSGIILPQSEMEKGRKSTKTGTRVPGGTPATAELQAKVNEEVKTPVLIQNSTRQMRGRPKKYDSTNTTCNVCGKSYDSGYLQDHIARHWNEKFYKCVLCNKGFNAKKDLKAHLKTHLGERPYSCSICKICFSRSSLLNYHMRSHTGERPYKCELCDMSFARPYGLRQHAVAMHTANKGRNMKCTITDCDQMFQNVTHRDVHIRLIHTGEKPYICPLCDKRYGSKNALTFHIKKHTQETPYSCPSAGCDKKYNHEKSLNWHIDAHHKTFLYECPLCPMKFKMKSELNRHMKSVNDHVGKVKVKVVK